MSSEIPSFLKCLLDNMCEGVAFVDSRMNILFWNRAAEEITQLSAEVTVRKRWAPEFLQLLDRGGDPIVNDRCQIAQVIKTRQPKRFSASLIGRRGNSISMEIDVVPAISSSDFIEGAVVFFHDSSLQESMEHELRQLHVRASVDPLTQVSNRAEFEREIEQAIKSHRQNEQPLSLIVCDIDRFKKVNDTFGHKAGDSALVSFTDILKKNIRSDDMVARYGGEEFVIICRMCEIDAANDCAEKVRSSLESIPQPALAGERLTASFGIAELEGPDDRNSLFVRADEALLRAKESGRNRVELAQPFSERPEIGSSMIINSSNFKHRWRKSRYRPILVSEYETPTPTEILVQKISGFIGEKKLKIIAFNDEFFSIQTGTRRSNLFRRVADRKPSLRIDIEMKAVDGDFTGSRRRDPTRVRITIMPMNSRDRRHDSVKEQATHFLRDLCSYLMFSSAELIASEE